MSLVFSPDKYIEALWFSAIAHGRATQLVPGTNLPYVCHPVLVAMELLNGLLEMSESDLDGDLDGDLAVQTALLHDTLEDTSVTFSELEVKFGAEVAKGVLALSKQDSAASGVEDALERKRIIMEDSLERIKAQRREVHLVKLADRICNLQKPPPAWSKEKIAYYKVEGKRILDVLGKSSGPLAKRLRQRILDYERFL